MELPPRQVAPRRANLLLDEVEIVEDPLRCRRDATAALDGFGNQLVRVAEHDLVCGPSWQQSINVAAPRFHHVVRRQRFGMLFQLADAQQLGSQRLFVRRLTVPIPPSAQDATHQRPRG